MARRMGSFRRKTRQKFAKDPKEKGRIPIARIMQQFKLGEKTYLKMDSSIHTGPFFRRFHGRTGIVTGKQGDCYLVEIKDKDKNKTVIVHPAHMRKVTI